MKRHYKLIAAAALLALAGCNREPLVEEPGAQVLSAEIVNDTATRTAYDGTTGHFSWEVGDELALFQVKESSAYKFQKAEIKTVDATSGRGQFVYSKETGWSRTGYAVYPASLVAASSWDGSALTLTLPASYPASASARLPLVADNSGGDDSDLAFYAVCGLLRIQCENIPTGVTSLTVTVNGDNSITGEFSVAFPQSGQPYINAVSGSANTVTFTSVSGTTATLNIPLPCGNYTGVTVTDGTHSVPVNAPFTAQRGYGKKLKVNFSE